MGQIGTGNIQPNRLSASGQQQGTIGQLAAIVQLQLALCGVDMGHLCRQTQVNALLLIKRRRAQRQPIGWCLASQIILGEIGPRSTGNAASALISVIGPA